jgi:hypothetical protein
MPVSLFDRIIGKEIGDGAVEDHSVHTVGAVLEFTAPSDLYFVQFDISNVETTGIQVTVEVESGGKIIEWVSSVQIPVGSTLSAFEGQKGVLLSGDKIRVKCDTATRRVDLWASFIREINT